MELGLKKHNHHQEQDRLCQEAYRITHPFSRYYPHVQQLELILRNSIDKAAKERFGEYWWNTVRYDDSKDNHTKFIKGIRSAELTLRKRGKNKQAACLGSNSPSKAASSASGFGHDDIIAATSFSTWEAVLLEAWHTDLNADKHLYLWPLSLTKAFRRLSVIDHRPTEARRKVLNLLKEIRDYRNRLFHHDCIWIKSKSVDAQTAIESIREKINSTNFFNRPGVESFQYRLCLKSRHVYFISSDRPHLFIGILL